MKIIERGSILLSSIGLVMKILNLTGGNSILMLGLSFLALIYFYLGFALFNQIRFRDIFNKSSYADVGAGHVLGGIGAGLLISIVIIGILFKLLILSGASEMLTIGLTGLIVVLLAGFVVLKFKKNRVDAFYRSVFFKGGIAVALGLLLFLIPTPSLIRFYYRNNPEYAEQFVKAIQNPNDEKIQQEFDEARENKHKQHPK